MRKCGLSIEYPYCTDPVDSCENIDNAAQCNLGVEQNS